MKIEAKTLLEFFEGHPERFTTKNAAEDKHGNEVSHLSSDAIRWCVIGAAALLGISYRKLYTQIPTIVTWTQTHSFNELIELLRRVGV